MINLSNTKSKDFLEIEISAPHTKTIKRYSRDKILQSPNINSFTKGESEKLRKELTGYSSKQRIKIINHIVGSIKDYYNFLKEN
jgi:hypothetical protein